MLPTFLNAIKQEIVCPLVILFKKVLSEEAVPVDWKEANVVPVFKGAREVLQRIIDL